MSTQIPDSHVDLVENANFATVATVMPDGQPQLSVVWMDYEDGVVKFSTAEGRQKADNLAERPQITLLVIDPENGYRYLEVRGTASVTKEGAVEFISAMAKKYRGLDNYYDLYDDEEMIAEDKAARVIVTITPEHVVARG